MKRLVPGFLLACLLSLPGTALAQRGQGWSILGADSLGTGNTVFSGQVGWPGLTLGLLHGGSSNVDVGGKFTFNWGREGAVDFVDPGVKLQLWLRVMLAKTNKVSLALTFQPGPIIYFEDFYRRYGGGADFGMALPVSLTAGFPVGSALMLNAGIDIPFHVYFGEDIGAVVPILFGGGVEYFLNSQMNVNFSLKMGPSVYTRLDNSYFTMEALAGIAYRF
ncbi:hypothetical protein KRR26_34235 [Corallococcus sp. M34]|uniref:hypothetical protein n=1 Tax=Citreicoccus inhibens TaxID=2849499 RepID=UPI0018F617CC|nr:hypothetical protein [Citreicoccus inhibens]MBU8900680.1 hypothetical protein [Citreicoccus inhibens]